ncbi:MAG: ferritin-like protein [Alphaproteobacteria bacterium]|nr:ferritin-like protein [Alphaproteobacteria bacterium]MBV9371569.1 ferritin-like protein [Alphaproteobacteria bacterium]MBV9902689.1 ferritin-like protein [Alphaproteobacteria bacterium]
MLQIASSYIERVASAEAPEDLYDLVNDAIRLEHATIPAYLSAWFSLKPGTNAEVGAILRSIVIEEMLHMAIASNLLIAIGGAPKIDEPGFIPTYPGPLPMDVGHGVIVGLERCSTRLIVETFMQIEEPEQVLQFPSVLESVSPVATIGQFYKELLVKLKDLGPGAFKGDFSRELTGTQWFSDQLFEINDFDSASRAVEIIVVQGEGTTQSPDDASGELAHYYRFRQVVEGRLLVQGPSGGWAYAGAPVSLDNNGVYPMKANAKSADYPPGSRARAVVDTFNAAYSDLLRSLHCTFNGEKAQIDVAMGLMYDLRFAAQDVLATPNPSGSGVCGLPFEYVPA